MSPAELSERIALPRRRRGDRAVRHRHAKAIFPVRCSSRRRRSNSNGRIAIEMAEMAGANAMPAIPTCCAPPANTVRGNLRRIQIRHRRRAARRAFRHRGLADLAQHRLRVRRDRDPARRRGDPARRMRGGACDRRRRLGDAGIAGALFAAVGAVDPERSAASRRRSRFPRTATAS